MSEPRCACGYELTSAEGMLICSQCGLKFFKPPFRPVADPGAGEDKGLLLKNFPVMIAEECPRDTIELRDTATGKLKSSIKESR